MQMLQPQIGHYVGGTGFCFFYSEMIQGLCMLKRERESEGRYTARKKKGPNKSKTERIECWRDLQQCLTVRNSVVYINRNLFHSLSEPGEPRV